MNARGRRWLTVAGVVTALFLTLCCCGAGWLGLRMHDGREEALDAAIEDLRARGEPVELADLDPPPLPEDENGWPLLVEAWEWLEDHGAVEPPAEAYRSQAEFVALPSERLEELATVATRLAPFFATLEQGLDRETSHRSPDPTGVHLMDVELRHVQWLSRSRMWLTLRLRLADTSGERLATLRDLGRLGTRWDSSGSAIEALVASSLVRGALYELRGQVAERRVEAAAARVAVEDALSCDAGRLLRSAMRGDRALQIDVIRKLAGDRPGTLPSSLAGEQPGKNGHQDPLARRALVRHIEATQQIIDATRESWTAASRAAAPLRERWQMIQIVEGYGPALLGGSAILLSRFVAQGAGLAADQRLARCALAAAIQRDETGAWPATLDDLNVPAEARIDPFTDAPLRYELLPDGGLRISSAGPSDAAIWGAINPGRLNDEREQLTWELR